MKHDYEIVGMRDEDAPSDSVTFGCILKNNPKYEKTVFIYENLIVNEETSNISVGLVMLEGDRRIGRGEMSAEDEQIMIEIIQQISEDVMTGYVAATESAE